MLIIDRFEGNYAVCESDSGEMVSIRKSLIESDAREGDVIVWADVSYLVDKDRTTARKRHIRTKMDHLFSRKRPT